MGDIIHQVNSAPGGQYSLENSAWGTVFTSENWTFNFLGGGKIPYDTCPHAVVVILLLNLYNLYIV